MEKFRFLLLNNFFFGAVLAAIIGGLSTLVNQRYGQFFEQDPSISYYDQKEDTVTTTMLTAICLSVSIGIVLIFYFIPLGDNRKAKAVEVISMFYGLYMSALTAAIVTGVMKASVGRPRPVALYKCNYMGYKTAVDSGNYTSYYALTTFGKVGNVENCYESSVIDDMWSSFPSGHSSFSFSTMIFSFFVLRKILSLPNNIHYGYSNILAYCPVVLCTWISVTRIINMKHHVDDVIAGALIGVGCAFAAWLNTQVMTREALAALGVIAVNNSADVLEEGLVELSSRATNRTSEKNIDV